MIKLFSHGFYTITGKCHKQWAILLMSVNLDVLRIAIVATIPVSGNRKNPRFLRFLGQVETRLKSGVSHFSAMSLSVNRGWHTSFLGQLTCWCEYGISQCFVQDFTDCRVILSVSDCGLIIRGTTVARAD